MMNAGSWGNEDIRVAYDIRINMNEVLKDINWYTDFSKKLETYANTKISAENKRDLAFIIDSIIRENDINLRNVIANLYYASNQIEKAIDAWEKFLFITEVPSFPTKYIEAKLQIANNQENREEALLWTGKLMADETSLVNKKYIAIANEFLKLLTSIGVDNISDENSNEIIEDQLFASIIVGNKEDLHLLAHTVEKNSTNNQTRVDFYKKAILLTKDETTAIFIKERWAFCQKEFLKHQNPKEQDFDKIISRLNQIFEQENFPFEKSNFPWTVDEITFLNNVPQPISDIPPNHLTEITIFNYRKFKKIQLKNIGKYNLILGDNNSGKTSLLEALLFSHEPTQQLSYLSFTHNLRKNDISINAQEILNDIKNNKAQENQHIAYHISKGRHNWEYFFRHPTIREIQNQTKSDFADPKNYLVLEKENSNIELQFSNPINIISTQDTFEIPFVPFGKGFSFDLTINYYNLIGSKDRKTKEHFFDIIRYFIPQIYSIETRPSDNCLIIEEKINDDNYIKSPLYNYGEGVNKLFRILIQLYTAKGKRLMIDEIDAGIHYSRFKKFWKIILYAAKELDVQLFVTTHNEECIRYFHEVLSEEEFNCCKDDSRLITLEYLEEEDRVITIIRDFDSIDYAIKHNLETRGDE